MLDDDDDVCHPDHGDVRWNGMDGMECILCIFPPTGKAYLFQGFMGGRKKIGSGHKHST